MSKDHTPKKPVSRGWIIGGYAVGAFVGIGLPIFLIGWKIKRDLDELDEYPPLGV